ncbi:hypothetical protein QA811_17700 [Streptomyces sp. B21-102]|uniref:hypothetical protein n=1 Tax=Streptomyces sp. B21-102 TaxID=3039416 RepID=UPI002FF238C9
MTAAKAKAEAAEPTAAEEPKAVPECGAPHYLPALAHIRCQRDEQDPDRAPGTPDHQHRHQIGDTLYQW